MTREQIECLLGGLCVSLIVHCGANAEEVREVLGFFAENEELWQRMPYLKGAVDGVLPDIAADVDLARAAGFKSKGPPQ